MTIEKEKVRQDCISFVSTLDDCYKQVLYNICSTEGEVDFYFSARGDTPMISIYFTHYFYKSPFLGVGKDEATFLLLYISKSADICYKNIRETFSKEDIEQAIGGQ